MRPPPELKDKQPTIACPVCCEAIASEAVDRYGGYQLYQCPGCDLMFWDPMKSPEAEYYETMYEASPELVSFKAVKILWPQKRFLMEAPAKGGELLDIGCGFGDFLYEAKKNGYAVSGLDFSPEFINIARQRFGLERLHVATPEDFISQNPDSRYDVVTFFEVLEHLDNITGFLSLVKKLLKPGGYVACGMPNRERWRFFSRQLLSGAEQERDFPPHHLTRWNPTALTNLFERHGFSVLAVDSEPLTPGSFSYGGWLISSKLGLQNRGFALARKLAAKKPGPDEAPQTRRSSPAKRLVIKAGGWVYYKVFIMLLGLVTSPLWFLVRRGGASNYLLARLNETDDKAAEAKKP